MARELHVSKNGRDTNTGTEEFPLLTISRAAEMAEEGDRVIVHEGVYREWVNPPRGGRCAAMAITYEAAAGERAVIKGSEEIQGWEKAGQHCWKAVCSNDRFGAYNPYAEVIDGDWLMRPVDPFLHTGQVYLNGKALQEKPGIEEVEETPMSWCCRVSEDITCIYANFGEAEPAGELVEINVRRSCFYPERTGINYITVRGFEMAQAACPWAPPTADQPGMLGTHWSRGWVIENNILHDARCSAISVGKEISTGHNLYTRYQRKSGYRYQLETVFAARRIGWSRETIGSHTIRNNTIYDCGQNGIVGHMGGAFSEISGNHIYRIGNLNEFFGFEIAGIKLHAAIDTQICHNHVHDCSLGLWLDWQAQGTRVSANLFHHNGHDMWIEVTHGPHLVDNNIFASRHNYTNASQGGAYVHNLFWGEMNRYDTLDRSTPYHLPHSTDIMGTSPVYGGDERFYQNIFVGGEKDPEEQWQYGTARYDEFTESMEEYIAKVNAQGRGDIHIFMRVRQPVYMGGNCYLDGAPVSLREHGGVTSPTVSDIRLDVQEDRVYLEFNFGKECAEADTELITTEKLGIPRISEAPYDNPDGTELVIDRDYFGKVREKTPTAGPFEGLSEGRHRILVWEKR